jgi:Fibronectin type III-like domain
MTDPIGLVPPEYATLEERAALTAGSSTWTTAGIPGVLPELLLSDGPHGLRVPGAGSIACRSAPATCFPTAAALGSSWNPDLAAEVGAAIGREARPSAGRHGHRPGGTGSGRERGPGPVRSFRKLHLAAGGSGQVSLILSERDFALGDVADDRWSVPAGEYRIEVGASSRDIRLHAVVSSPGDGHRRELTEVSTVAEWLADPDGRAHLEPVLARIPAELLEQAPEVRHIVLQLPAVKLCGFGLGLDAGQLRRMVAAVRSACVGFDDRAAPEGAASA